MDSVVLAGLFLMGFLLMVDLIPTETLKELTAWIISLLGRCPKR